MTDDTHSISKWKIWLFLSLLFFDSITTVVLLTPLIPPIVNSEALVESHYTLHGSLLDVALTAVLRIMAAVIALWVAYHRRPTTETTTTATLYHLNGDRKTPEELETEALEEDYAQSIRRCVFRLPFACEMAVLVTGVVIGLKCLARLNVELARSSPCHVMFWAALGLTAFCATLELLYLETVEQWVTALGAARRGRRNIGWLGDPLLASSTDSSDCDGDTEAPPAPPRRGVGATPEYRAKWTDLLAVCEPDKHMIAVAFVFLILSSIASVCVPLFTGEVLGALVNGDTSSNLVDAKFVRNIEFLVSASILAGVFGGMRGAIFTLVGARVNTRLRIRLMDSLLSQDIGFFDTTKTGDLTSRLSSDTTIVGMSVTSLVNIFMRSSLMAIGYLVFMASISWQLSIVSFITIPAISVLSKWYGRYLRKLSRLQQKKLAEGSSVSEATISAMPTVRAFGAETIELKEFEECMQRYLNLSTKTAVATFGYTSCLNALPELVKALVLFYGGLMVRSTGKGHITGSQLISFILYLSALSGAFNSLGGIYASLVRAVGAADKVFELIQREPKRAQPKHVDQERIDRALAEQDTSLLGVKSSKIVAARVGGLYPEVCRGDIMFENVTFSYPARPERVVLNNLSLRIKEGSIVAIVGTSGSGKSSIVKLIQNLYEPSNGKITIDGVDVKEVSLNWLCQHVSVVQQEPVLFARSVQKNIVYGFQENGEPAEDEVVNAANLANAASFIDALPGGYEAEVGERGIQLSGGQKQRVAIARALVRRPKILLLDESTSALDSESEHIVQTAIDGMISGHRQLGASRGARSMTVVIVAHRLSTVRNADRIVVIKEGQVAEQGSHDELKSIENGVYANLINKQRDS